MTENFEAVYPLSPMQRGMLFHTLLAPDSGTYFNQLHGVFEGPLDPKALDTAWQCAAASHAILRTAFAWEGLAEPLQAVLRKAAIPTAKEDWRGMSRDQQQIRLQEFLLADRRRGFSLGEAPLMRFALMQLEQDRYQFVWSHHHLLMDAWSMSLLLQEVFEHYGRLSAGSTVRLVQARPYGDYVSWLRRQDLSAAEAYWRSLLADFHSPTPLPGERAGTSGRGGANVSEYGDCGFSLSPETTSALQGLARTHQLTLNTLVQAAWGVLLSSYSGNADVVFGSVTSTRPPDLAGADKMLGLFINTLPVRVRVTSEPLLQWVKAFQNVQADSRQHHYASLVDVHGWSGVSRDTPLFESVVVFENSPAQTLTSNTGVALRIRDIGAYERTSLPLTLVVAPGAELAMKLMYETDRFDQASARRTLQHLANILTGMCNSPEQPVCDLSMLSATEREELLVTFNRPAALYENEPVHRLFEACVENNPDAVAVVHEGVSLSYGELNRRANRLARHLQALGVGPETLVAIALDRSLEMLVGILATLKAGGAYLPLDLSYPRERLAFMLADSHAAVLLCSSATAATLGVQPASSANVITVVDVERDAALISAQLSTNPAPQVGAENRAYVIYTSGSTGRPKGVQIRHAAVSNFRAAMLREPGITAADTLLAVTVFSFDISVLELLLPLTAGARIVLASRAASADPIQLRALLESNDVTILQATPVTWRMLLEAGWAGNPRMKALCGGEAVAPALAQRLAEVTGELWNMYGPTETTVWSTCQRILKTSDAISIGGPIANTEVYILDTQLQPVPCGVAGELYIGGDGLARGYYGRPDLTAERFVPNPFSGRAGARLYRTGDLARFFHDGTIDFLGRADHQVKIRGFRIEPDEIQACLAKHPAVSDALVLARQDGAAQTRLVAYVVADAAAVSIDQLRRHLSVDLPDYMIPSAFVFLAAFPRTPNGKLDRNALPAPDSEQRRLGLAFRAPRSDSEELLAGLFADLLGLDQVGIDDNFFELGGHSLLATQLVSRIRSTFRADLSLRSVFESPSVAALAYRIGAAVQTSALPISRADRSVAIPASNQQRRMWLLDRFEDADRSIYNTPFVLRITGSLDCAAVERSLNELSRRHEVLRTTVYEKAGALLQSIQPFAPFALPIVDLTHVQLASRLDLAMQMIRDEMQKLFDLEKGPVFEAKLFAIDEELNVLYVNVHHMASDAWSLGIFCNDFSKAYAAFSSGQSLPADEPGLQYADYAAWQAGMLGSGGFESQLGYWGEQAQLRSTANHAPYTAATAGSISFEIPAALAEEVAAFGKRESATVYMVLLSAFHLLLGVQNPGEASLVGTALANRVREGAENMIGFFANPVALGVRFQDDMTLRNVVEQVRESVLSAMANQEAVPDSVQGVSERGLEPPLFSTWFALEPSSGAVSLAGLPCQMIPIPAPTVTRLHLTMRFRQDERLTGRIEYREDLFDPDQVREMLRQFETILELLVQDPDQPVADLFSCFSRDVNQFSVG